MKSALTLLLAGTLGLAMPALANEHDSHDSHHPEQPVAGAQVMTKGVITKVDQEAGKVGIRHEAIANLGMPPMTMIFKAADPALLEGLKSGDAVEFFAEKRDGALVLVSLSR
ncbi:copper-binding protein [Aeromonas diversa]|uniref:copper-binding protein n=1 Tax=Aeromonas diversa TaxID=502790 RepID=UPI0034631980